MDILDEAGSAERFMPKPKIPKAASMYDILEYAYDPKDLGFYDAKKLKLRANNKQINCWDLTVTELLPLVELEDRQILWARSRRYSWVALAKMFGCHRVTIKKKYINAIFTLESKLNKTLIDKIDNI
jgi:hypothetical protein